MDATVTAIEELPPAVLVSVCLMVIVGIGLWAAGRQLLKPCVAVMGALLGGTGGWLIGEQLTLGPPPWACGLTLALIMACLAVLLFRVVITMTLAGVIAMAAPVGLLAAAQYQDLWPGSTDEEAPPIVATAEEAVRPVDPLTAFFERDRSAQLDTVEESLGFASEFAPETLDPETVDRISEARTFVEQVIEDAQAAWERTPVRLRAPILVSTVIGLLVGLVLGTFAPTTSTTIVTAFGGSLLWLTGLHTVLVHVGEPAAQIMPNTPAATAAVWLSIALFGVLIQWIFRAKPADTSP